MRQLKTGVALLALALIAVPAIRAQMMSGSTADQPRVFQVRIQSHSLSPSVLMVNRGDHVRLIVTAVDRDYALELKAFGISQELKKGVPTPINFTAIKTGKFGFRCSGLLSRVNYFGTKASLVVREPAGTLDASSTH